MLSRDRSFYMDSNVVRVNILGQEYVMKTSANPQYIQDVAKYVNEKMDEIKQSGVDSSSQQLKIAVLAGMNITDELFNYKKEKNKFVEKVEAKTIALTEFIENRIHDIEADEK